MCDRLLECGHVSWDRITIRAKYTLTNIDYWIAPYIGSKLYRYASSSFTKKLLSLKNHPHKVAIRKSFYFIKWLQRALLDLYFSKYRESLSTEGMINYVFGFFLYQAINKTFDHCCCLISNCCTADLSIRTCLHPISLRWDWLSSKLSGLPSETFSFVFCSCLRGLWSPAV